MEDLREAEQIIGYVFTDKELLARAFTHASYVNEKKYCIDYERLEFLGDAILGYIVGECLFHRFPTAPEGFLSQHRAFLVNANTLGNIVDELGLIRFMRVGNHNESTVFTSQKVKCDLFEAIVAAIYLDSKGDILAVRPFIMSNLEKKFDEYDVDYKSRTLEYCAKNKLSVRLVTTKKEDEGNAFHFVATLYFNGSSFSQGEGQNKRAAEKNACKIFYERFIK